MQTQIGKTETAPDLWLGPGLSFASSGYVAFGKAYTSVWASAFSFLKHVHLIGSILSFPTQKIPSSPDSFYHISHNSSPVPEKGAIRYDISPLETNISKPWFFFLFVLVFENSTGLKSLLWSYQLSKAQKRNDYHWLLINFSSVVFILSKTWFA